MCKDNNIPILVFDLKRPDNILELLREEYEAKILDAMKKNPTE